MGTGSGHEIPADWGLPWSITPFEALTDLLIVMDPFGTMIYGNEFTGNLLGYRREDVVGDNIAGYIHPDDVGRALRVLEMMGDPNLAVPITPAIYRLLRSDGEWCRVEINSSVIHGATPEGDLIVVFGRYSGDRDLQDRIMEALTTDTPSGELIGLVPEFGLWRHSNEHYGVLFTADDGSPDAVGSTVARELSAIGGADTPWARAIASGGEVVAQFHELPADLRAAAAERGLTHCWAIPVDDPSFAEPAVIVTWCRVDGPPIEVHRYALEMMARALTVILQWRQQVSNLRRAARRDPLTGLANRTGFWEVLEGLGERGGVPNVGVLYVDLDGFKVVNDDHGHRVGDVVLAEAAQRLAAILRPGDAVARLGGDEFAVVCRDLATDEDAVVIAERVVEVLDQPFLVGGREVRIGASVGIATMPVDALDPDELLDAADRALYRAKRDGRGRWHLAGRSA